MITKPVSKRVNIKSENQLSVISKLSQSMKEGRQLPLINIKSPEVLFTQLDADKNLTVKDKKLMLTRILESNKRRIEEKKIAIEKMKLLKKQKKYKNFDGGYQHKYTESQIAAQAAKVASASSAKVKAQSDYDYALIKFNAAEKVYTDCKAKILCNVHKNNVLSSYTSWRDVLAQKATEKTNTLTTYTQEKALYDTMVSEDSRFVEQQRQDAREAEARSEELRQQEMHEAELKAEGLSLQNVKIEIAKQAAEIAKLESEEKKIAGSESFGATVVNNITGDNKKLYYVLAAIAVAFAGYFIYKRYVIKK